MSAILILGFLLGLRHALEADHIAAVATLAARSSSPRQALLQGAVWGLGHTLALFLVCSIVLFSNTSMPERLVHGLEAVVGMMLVLLGMDLLRRMLQERIHIHTHRHDDGTVHLHAHSHAGDTEPHSIHHRHEHPRRMQVRALYVGLMHGMAGSAALILLTLGSVASPFTGLLYVALFGLGSMGGMALLSITIGMTLRRLSGHAGVHSVLLGMVGIFTVLLGSFLLIQNSITLAT